MPERTALIIDDEPDVTTYHATLLEDNGWQVTTSNSAERGLEMAFADPPSVILLDVMMPERGGLSTLVALRKDERTRSIPVVLVTGVQATVTSDFEAFLQRIKNYHPDAYIEKPIDPDVLLRTLDEVTATA